MADISLNFHEARLLGVLIEKELTTPDGYPLTLNAAISGANQKSNRHPITDYTEAEVWIGFTGLMAKKLASKLSPAGSSRVEKFKHLAPGTLGLEQPELAVLTELLLRGSQTKGELRTRASRMSPIATLEDLTGILDNLMDKGYLERRPPAPGSRAERYGQLLCPEAAGATPAPKTPAEDAAASGPPPSAERPSPVAARSPTVTTSPPDGALARRMAELESRVEKLEDRLGRLAKNLGDDS
jgi:hypothetical protein